MHHPILLISGSALIGWLIPEFFLAISHRKLTVPALCNIISAVGCGLIVAAIVCH
jgi:hypothetical protein